MPISFDNIKLGSAYSRPTLAEIWGYKDYHALARGVFTPKNDSIIILFVTAIKQGTVEQYNDLLSDDILKWEGPKGHSGEDRILQAKNNSNEIHLFYRKIHHSDFIYYGKLALIESMLETTRSSKFIFKLLD